MLKRDYVLILMIPILCLLVFYVFFEESTNRILYESKISFAPEPPSKVLLPVPFISEAPDGIWTGSWINACEEASIAMVEKFYAGQSETPINEAKEFMKMLFAVQQKLYGSDMNSDAERTNHLINNYSNFDGRIVTDPSLEDIKEELRGGRPVISLHHGFKLGNPNTPFKPTGSAFHVIVIIGYDNSTQKFIAHDNGDSLTGTNHEYDYSIFMNSLHDYNYSTHKSEGPPRVIFTSPRI